MKIAVCDDNSIFLSDLKIMLEQNKLIEGVKAYSDPEELVKDIKYKNIQPDAVFMDIEYNKSENGLHYGTEIFKLNSLIQIVYVTGYQGRFDQEMFLHDSNLTGYITKPVDKNILDQYIEKMNKNVNEKSFLNFSVRGKEHIIPVSDIIYLESCNHKTILHTVTEDYSVYEKLVEFEKRLPDMFIHCHKSFLVNMDKVKYVDASKIYINEEIIIPISRSHKDEVKIKYFDYIGQKL